MSRWKIPVILTVAAAGIAWLVWTGVSQNDLYMSPLDDWDPARAQRERVRVVGFVQEGSIIEAENELLTDFVMRNETGTLSQAVRFRGVVPDLFREGQNVTAAGRLGEDGVFHADELMTKCPSKYEGAEEHPENVPMTPGAGAPASPTADAGSVDAGAQAGL